VTPAANQNGTATITITVNDGTANTNTTFTLTVNAVNDAPVAVNDSYSTPKNTALAIAAPGVLSNDTDVDSTILTAALVTGPTHAASFTLNPDGSFSYTPASNYFGADSFTYRTNDGITNSNTATVSLNVTNTNTAPVAVNDSYSTNEDTMLTIAAAGVLSNDTDVDGNTLTAIVAVGPTHGTLVLNANGSFTYTPAANYYGPDSFTYNANDGTINSASPATVSLTVNPVNDAPTITSIANQTINEDASTSALSFTIGDVETAATSLTVSGNSSNTTLVPTANIVFGGSGASRTVTVTPAAGQSGSANITITVNDGTNSTSTTFTLTVTVPLHPADTNSDNKISQSEVNKYDFCLQTTGTGSGCTGTLANPNATDLQSAKDIYFASPTGSYSYSSGGWVKP
jgi:VCBS repeat-containing protein